MNKAVLENLGYQLSDHGLHWRARAIYRNGKSNTSLIIYKDTGVWRDFGAEDNQPFPFRKLVELTLSTTDPVLVSKYTDITQSKNKTETAEKLKMQKIYPNSVLEKLLPMREFYENRGISAATQEEFKCGYASEGKLYQRIVFPIYNEDDRICGFSGRLVVDNPKKPKWKHIGNKSNWIFPRSAAPYIEEEQCVILVESIGDCLALWEMGIRNVLVMFGLNISKTLMSYLTQFNLEGIIVANNNDSNKERNNGGLAAIKNLAQLSLVFDFEALFIALPTQNDFGEMLAADLADGNIRGKYFLNRNFNKWAVDKEKFCLSDESIQAWIKDKIKSNEGLKNNTHCKKLLKKL